MRRRSIWLSLCALIVMALGAPRDAHAAPMPPGSVDLESPVAAVDGSIEALSVLPDGRVLIAGGFTNVGGLVRRGVARLQANGAVDASFDPGLGANKTVRALAWMDDGRVLVAGEFTQFDGQERWWLVRLLATGALDPQFSFTPPHRATNQPPQFPSRSPAAASVVVQQSGHIILAGPDQVFLRLRPDGGVDRDDIYGFIGGSGAGYDYIDFSGATLLRGDKILVTRTNFVALEEMINPNGAVGGSFSLPPAFGRPRQYVELPDGRLLVAGAYYSTGGASAGGLLRLLPDRTVDPGFLADRTTNGTVRAIAVQTDGRILIGGTFTNLGNTTRRTLARLLPDGAVDATFDAGVGGGLINALAMARDGRVIVAGEFRGFGGAPRTNLAWLYNDASGPPFMTVPPTNQTVFENQDAFFAVGTPAAPFEFQWMHQGTNLPGASNALLKLRRVSAAVDAGEYVVVVANAFGAVTSAVVSLTVEPLPETGGWPDRRFAFVAGMDDRCRVVARQNDGRLLVAGFFNTTNRGSQSGLLRLQADGRIDETFAARVDGVPDFTSLQAMAVQPDGRVLIAGQFTNVNGVARKDIARLNPDGSLDSSFDAAGGAGVNGAIAALALPGDGQIVVAGPFDAFNGQPFRKHVVRLSASGALDTSFATISGVVPPAALGVQRDGRIIVGGGGGMLRLQTNGMLDSQFLGPVSGIRSLLVLPDDRIVIGCTVGSSFPTLAMVRALANGANDASFQALYVYQSTDHIRAMTLDDCGKLLIAGLFRFTNSSIWRNVARLNEDGTVDSTFDAGPADGGAHGVLGWPDSALVVGDFDQVHGVRHGGVARLRTVPAPPVVTVPPASLTVTSGYPVTLSVAFGDCRPPFVQWSRDGAPLSGATNASLQFAAVQMADSGVYTVQASNLAGPVSSPPGVLTVVRSSIASGALDTATPPGTGADAAVLALAPLPDGGLLMGGAFTNVQGLMRRALARLDARGTLDATFNASVSNAFDPSNVVTAIALLADGKAVIGGAFSHVGGTNRNNLARVSADGRLDASFPSPSSFADTITDVLLRPDGRVAVGTDEFEYLRWYLPGGVEDSMAHPVPHNVVLALASDAAGRLVLAGDFVSCFSAGTTFTRRRVARLSPGDLTLDLSFDPGLGPNAWVRAVALQPDGRVIIGGGFTNIAGVTRRGVARLNSDGSLDLGFDAGAGADAPVHALALQTDGTIYAGGAFTNFGGHASPKLVRLLADGSPDTLFNSGVRGTGEVWALETDAFGRLWVGGSFTNFAGLSRRGLVRLHGPLLAAYPVRQAGALSARVLTTEGWTYVLERTESLPGGAWMVVSQIPGDGTVRVLTDVNAGAASGFYRVRAE